MNLLMLSRNINESRVGEPVYDKYLSKRDKSFNDLRASAESLGVNVKFRSLNISSDYVDWSDVVMVRYLGNNDVSRVANYCAARYRPLYDEYLRTHPHRVMSKLDIKTKLLELAPMTLDTFSSSSPKDSIWESIEPHIGGRNSVIVKANRGGRRGLLTFKVKSEVSFKRLMATVEQDKERDYIIEQYIENDGDIRVIAFMGHVIGQPYKRGTKNTIRRSGSSGRAKLINKTSGLEEAIMETYQRTGITFMSVDVLASGGRYHIVDVNASPSYGVWAKLNNSNPWDYILRQVH